MDTVLLFGGRSFLGGHICRVLIDKGYRVLLHSRSSGDFKNLLDVLPTSTVEPVTCRFDQTEKLSQIGQGCQTVIHCAIPYHTQSIGSRKKIEADLREFLSTLRVLSTMNIKKAVFVSVSGTIGRKSLGIADEKTPRDNTFLKSWGHLTEKLAAENIIFDFIGKGLNGVVVNPSMCIGQYDTKPSTGEFFKFISKFPAAIMSDALLNIVDVRDAALGTVLALEKGQVGEKYILSGTNTSLGVFINRIRALNGKPPASISLPRWAAIPPAYLSEIINLLVRRSKPIIPLLGIELAEQGSQHLSCDKAIKELGFVPRDAWPAVDLAYQWYKENGIL